MAAALAEAAEGTLQRAAVDEAADWVERALAEDAPDPPRAHLLARLGTARAIQRDLAASGATNTEIAQELYVSLKTVETHLSRSYLKLGLAGPGSRARLVRVLDETTAMTVTRSSS